MPEPSEKHLMHWLGEQFLKVNQKLDKLISNDNDQTSLLNQIQESQSADSAKLDQILKILQPPVDPNSPITPELEAIVYEVGKRAMKIDEKVPDKQVPPGSTPPH